MKKPLGLWHMDGMYGPPEPKFVNNKNPQNRNHFLETSDWSFRNMVPWFKNPLSMICAVFLITKSQIHSEWIIIEDLMGSFFKFRGKLHLWSHCKHLKLIEKYFLDLRKKFLNQENITISFLKTREFVSLRKHFLSLLWESLTWIEKTYVETRKPFLARK